MLAHTDIIFPSDNDYGIPVLDASLQSEAVYAPFARWGSYARSTRMVGCTWHFYTDDYKFSRLWKNPDRLLATGCAAVVEVNYSLAGETPLAYALWATYQKRWLARYWQAQDGVRVLVDLTVPERFQAVNLLGVPKGWGRLPIAQPRGRGRRRLRRPWTRPRVSPGECRPSLWYTVGEGRYKPSASKRAWSGSLKIWPASRGETPMGRGEGGTGRGGTRLPKGYRGPRRSGVGGAGLVVRGASASSALADAKAVEKKRADYEGRPARSFDGAKVEPVKGKPGFFRITFGGSK